VRLILLLIGALWAVAGFLLFSHPEGIQAFLRKRLTPERVKRMGPAPLAVGLVLGVGAFFSGDLFWVPLLLGLAGVAKGVYLYVAPTARVAELLDRWIHRASRPFLLRLGGVIFLLGMAIFAYAY